MRCAQYSEVYPLQKIVGCGMNVTGGIFCKKIVGCEMNVTGWIFREKYGVRKIAECFLRRYAEEARNIRLVI